MEVYTKRTGFWFLRGVKRHMEISILINAIDVVTGTLFLSNLERRRIKILPEENLFGLGAARTLSPEELNKIMSRLFKAQVSAITRTLRDHPWIGKIISVDGDKAVISGGADVGIKEGMFFEVFGRGEPIESYSGRIYYARGAKEGEITAVDVIRDRSLAVPVNGIFLLRPGQIIREK
jgi:hypothetical protein